MRAIRYRTEILFTLVLGIILFLVFQFGYNANYGVAYIQGWRKGFDDGAKEKKKFTIHQLYELSGDIDEIPDSVLVEILKIKE